ncbi:MAG: hypothetical protein AAGH65_08005 [Pseudomonadota bacterium]
MFNSSGGRFDNAAAVLTEAVGQTTLVVTSCSTAELIYTLDQPELEGRIDLIRLTPDEYCQQELE